MNDVDKEMVLSLRSAANTIIYQSSRWLRLTRDRKKKWGSLDKGLLAEMGNFRRQVGKAHGRLKWGP